ncbi:hypothetical protein HELRODRAFT_87508 [Helobdella robusta]|uniref:TFIIS N-terminal domain-containing protein n=1 Tax=Helobdella robusta TaxID=6412 RepID=T1G6R2_HELRO|nr:hypothetical protein HELRODRAFT_87508 [Helobdella robusta]ESN94852.1 hypothetical protein HELRODRAFT_87508 [Helobdella robusta]
MAAPDNEPIVYDFDLMMAKKKEERRRRKRKIDDVELINDNDDAIAEMIQKMNTAAEQDRQLNCQNKPAIRVMRQLPYVKAKLGKLEILESLSDSGIFSSIAIWLAPLPNLCLPHLEVREALLKQLLDYPPISSEALKASGLGKAVAYLFKHPKETANNKDRCQQLITRWAKPLFCQDASFKDFTREERQQRDLEHCTKKRKLSSKTEKQEETNSFSARVGFTEALIVKKEKERLLPEDADPADRARVPEPSLTEYIIRPKWKVESGPAEGGSRKRKLTRLDQLNKKVKAMKRASVSKPAVSVSLQGNNMSI